MPMCYHTVFSLKERSESLLLYWETKSLQKTNLCCEKLCPDNAVLGTMVYCSKTQKLFVIPLCSKHANQDKIIHIPSTFQLIPII